MHVLLIHQAFVSPKDAGGTRHYELAHYLVRQGHRFTVVASDLSYLTGKRIVEHRGLITEQSLNGVRELRAYTYPSLHRSFVWRVISFLSFMVTSVLAALRAGPIDVIMGSSPPIFQAVSAWLLAKLRHKPYLLEIRDLWPEFAIDIGILTNPLLIYLSRWLERFLYSQADHLLVNSPAYRGYLVTRGVPEAKISLIPNGVNPDLFHPDEEGERVRKELGLKGQFVVTYAGALGLANNITNILRAAKRLRDQHDIGFLLVGDGKERAHLEALAKQLDLLNSVVPELLKESSPFFDQDVEELIDERCIPKSYVPSDCENIICDAVPCGKMGYPAMIITSILFYLIFSLIQKKK